ncbi:hypothetical protein [Metaplanococcus flavidus]|uniref:Phage protein n=1 Tax=Metaplanococcus flavidus TaxID=569883 RepID=A0ABW3LG72_9BACL
MRGSFKNFGRRSSGMRVLDLYYLDRMLEHHHAKRDDQFIMEDLKLSKEEFEKYRNQLLKEGVWKQ